MRTALLRLIPAALALALLVGSCADPKAVNAAFSQTRVSWFLFDGELPAGLHPLSGFEQPQKTLWLPRPQAVYATDLAGAPGGLGAAAVAGLGLLVLDDGDGSLHSTRPGAQFPLGAYRTSRLFVWDGKLFITLFQEPPATQMPATLAWWAPGQERLAVYPIPSQVRDPARQLVDVHPPRSGSSLVHLSWKLRAGSQWVVERGAFDLADGSEPAAEDPVAVEVPGPEYDVVRSRLAERLGTDALFRTLRGPGVVAVYTEAGWVSVAREGEGRARLYRLPDLGTAGAYSGALALKRGFVFSWETRFRGYAGASGLVHVPFAVLSP